MQEDGFDPADEGQFGDPLPDNESAEDKSKSQRKREMTALQDLGKQLADFNEQQLDRFPLSEDLRAALREYQHIRKNEAKRRQLQYIGKLMRSEDHEGINGVFEEMDAERKRGIQREHLAEAWRDRLLGDDKDAVTDFVDAYPATDRQDLRNLVRNAQQERARNKPPTQARKLFRLIREIIAEAEGS